MKKILTCFIASASSLSAAHAFAAMPSLPALPAGYSWVGALSAGPVFESNGSSQTISPQPGVLKTYTANNGNNTLGAGELFLGVQKNLPYQLQGQAGLAVALAGDATFKGDIWDDANPAFNNYVYRYRVSHTGVSVKGKLLADRGYWLIPWISVSLGVGFNDAYGFTNTPTIFQAVPNGNYASNTSTAFTYTIGIGAQRTLCKHWQAGIAYEFSDWGKNQLDPVNGQSTNGPGLDHLYTNGVLLNLTYLA